VATTNRLLYFDVADWAEALRFTDVSAALDCVHEHLFANSFFEREVVFIDEFLDFFD